VMSWLAWLQGAAETKVRPAVAIASDLYLVERPDVLVGILTTKLHRTTSMDYVNDYVNGLRFVGLAIGRAPRRVVLPSLIDHDSSLECNGNWSPQ